jgi:hypothetical protein
LAEVATLASRTGQAQLDHPAARQADSIDRPGLVAARTNPLGFWPTRLNGPGAVFRPRTTRAQAEGSKASPAAFAHHQCLLFAQT